MECHLFAVRRSEMAASFKRITYKAEQLLKFFVQKELRRMFEKQEVSLDINDVIAS